MQSPSHLPSHASVRYRYAERTPYFLEARRLREQCDAIAARLRRLQAQREEELKNVSGRNAMITKTLASWNRALGAAGCAHGVPARATCLGARSLRATRLSPLHAT